MKGGRRSPRPANPGAAGICDLTHGGPALGRTGALLGHSLPELPLDPLPPRSPAARRPQPAAALCSTLTKHVLRGAGGPTSIFRTYK